MGLIVLAAMQGPVGQMQRAAAETGDLICPATFQANFSPPLTAMHTKADVLVQVLDVACESPNGANVDLKSGVWAASGDATSAAGANPCNLLLTMTAAGTIRWSPTGELSRFDLEINLDPTAGDIVASVVITSGVLDGDTVTGLGPLAPNEDCAVNGLSSLISAGVDVFA